MWEFFQANTDAWKEDSVKWEHLQTYLQKNVNNHNCVKIVWNEMIFLRVNKLLEYMRLNEIMQQNIFLIALHSNI